MDRKEMLKRLNDLIQLDVDAVEAYSQAIPRVKYDDVRQKLEEFQGDHRRHVDSIAALVREFGGEPVKPSPDLKGYMLEGFTALRSLTGTKGALEAMATNERLTNKRYQEAVGLDFPPPVLKVLKTNLTHEEIHLSYIQTILTMPRREL